MNFLLRIITAAILLPVVLFAVLYDQGNAFLILLMIVLLLGMMEYTHMVLSLKWKGQLFFFLGYTFFLCFFFLGKGLVAWPHQLFFLFLGIAFCMILKPMSMTQMAQLAALVTFGAYLLCAGWSFYELRYGQLGFPGGQGFMMLGLLCAWINDSFAYFCGKMWGKTPFFPTITKKTWEGVLGGGIATVVVLLVFYHYGYKWDLDILFGFEKADILWIALPACVLAPLGDLVESRLKRLHGVKDSSGILPGHGGVLDRIDSLLLVMMWVYFYVHAVKPTFIGLF